MFAREIGNFLRAKNMLVREIGNDTLSLIYMGFDFDYIKIIDARKIVTGPAFLCRIYHSRILLIYLR